MTTPLTDKPVGEGGVLVPETLLTNAAGVVPVHALRRRHREHPHDSSIPGCVIRFIQYLSSFQTAGAPSWSIVTLIARPTAGRRAGGSQARACPAATSPAAPRRGRPRSRGCACATPRTPG